MRVAALLLGVLVCSAVGCGGNQSPDTNNPPSYPSVAGNWYFRATLMDAGVYLSQSGGTVTGVAHVNSECFQQGDDIPISGTVDTSGNLALTTTVVPDDAYSMQVKGTVVNGALTNPSIAVPCIVNPPQTTETGGSVMPAFTGTYSGSLASNAGNPPLQLTAKLAQGTSVNQDGYLPLTGSATFTGTSCAAVSPATLVAGSGSISSTIVGPFVSLAFSNGLWIQGMLSADGTTLTVETWEVDAGACRDGGNLGTLQIQQ